jgi:uncharacterized protein YbbC (DUF1343 family)
MTIGEYAQMINGEGWLSDSIFCDLQVITLQNYDRTSQYSLPIKPSPNLPNDTSINLYPSLCFFEGTPISAGRGTNMQFQIYGAPLLPKDEYPFSFTPAPNPGAKYPKFSKELCYGEDMRNTARLSSIDLAPLIRAFNAYPKNEPFFTPFFAKLAGTSSLRQQIEAGKSAAEISNSWQAGLDSFKKMRAPYLLYK